MMAYVIFQYLIMTMKIVYLDMNRKKKKIAEIEGAKKNC